jgi:hypothetical protein
MKLRAVDLKPRALSRSLVIKEMSSPSLRDISSVLRSWLIPSGL